LALRAPVSARQQGRVDGPLGFDRTPGPSQRAMGRAAGGAGTRLVPAIAAQVPERPALSSNPRVTTIEPDGEVHAVGCCQEELA
jgi:hypothetical protein